MAWYLYTAMRTGYNRILFQDVVSGGIDQMTVKDIVKNDRLKYFSNML